MCIIVCCYGIINDNDVEEEEKEEAEKKNYKKYVENIFKNAKTRFYRTSV